MKNEVKMTSQISSIDTVAAFNAKLTIGVNRYYNLILGPAAAN